MLHINVKKVIYSALRLKVTNIIQVKLPCLFYLTVTLKNKVYYVKFVMKAVNF
jgi:hypothetical protein